MDQGHTFNYTLGLCYLLKVHVLHVKELNVYLSVVQVSIHPGSRLTVGYWRGK